MSNTMHEELGSLESDTFEIAELATSDQDVAAACSCSCTSSSSTCSSCQ